MSTCLTIAGHTLAVVGLEEEALLGMLPGFEPFISHDEAEWEIRFTDMADRPSFSSLYQFDFNQSIPCRFGKSEGAYLFEMGTGNEAVFMRYPAGNVVECSHCPQRDYLRFLLWMAFTLLAMSRRVMPIHASTIMNQNKAVLFLGESGTGKSTHTSLWLKHIPDSELLNDDSPILAIEEGSAVVYGSPWSGKTPCYKPLRCEVAGLVRLRQAPRNEIRRLDVMRSISALQPSLPPALAYDAQSADYQMELLSALLSQAPVFQLDCLPNAEAAQLSHKTLFQP